jgi:hypothetical protein
MATTNKLRKVLHKKAWEFCAPTYFVNTNNGASIAGDDGAMPQRDCIYFINAASGIYNYNADQDSWLQLPNSGIAGAYGAGACLDFRVVGMLGGNLQNTATAGTTTTITTNRTITRDIRGCRIRVVAGTGVGYNGTVASNTTGANAVITVTPANGVAFDATTVYMVWSGSLWYFNPGSTAVGFSVYDRATNTWTAKSVTGLPTAWGTTGQLIGTGSVTSTFDSGTSSGTNTTTTLNDTAKAWQVNAWTNYQIRITAGTGAGQYRTVASNTANAITVSAAWTVTPDATSQYAIEGNDDFMYLLGNNAVTLYRYSIINNTWTTLAPTAARAAAMGAGGCADWIGSVNDPDWSGAQGKTLVQGTTFVKQNGRYIYSLRGAGSGGLDVYDIALNTWYSSVAYGQSTETFTTGSFSVQYGGYIYITKENTGRIFRFDVAKHVLEPWATNLYPQSTTVEGDKAFVTTYVDGNTVIPFYYTK